MNVNGGGILRGVSGMENQAQSQNQIQMQRSRSSHRIAETGTLGRRSGSMSGGGVNGVKGGEGDGQNLGDH